MLSTLPNWAKHYSIANIRALFEQRKTFLDLDVFVRFDLSRKWDNLSSTLLNQADL